MDIIVIYLIIINALGFLLMLIDKSKARNNRWRIPEATLLTVAAIGGSLGSFAGMKICHHKTKHPRFSIGIPVMMAIHILIFWYVAPLL